MEPEPKDQEERKFLSFGLLCVPGGRTLMEVVTRQVSAQQILDCCLLLSKANQERRGKAIMLIDFYYFLYIEIKGKVKKA